MKMEKWDLYNAKREKSGITVCRGEIIPKGLYHLSVSVWIVNQQGQYLLSQRHPKKQYPLYWECTGGSVLSGETSLQGAIREVKEELGILLTPGSEKLIYQSRRENVQDFYDVWLFHKDIKIEEMRLQETELTKLKAELERVKKLKKSIYEDYKDELISKEEFLSYREDYQQKETLYSKQIETLEEKKKESVTEDVFETPWLRRLLELKDIEELDRDIIVEMIDQITVYENHKLKISYNFGNELEHLFSSVYCEDLEKKAI